MSWSRHNTVRCLGLGISQLAANLTQRAHNSRPVGPVPASAAAAASAASSSGYIDDFLPVNDNDGWLDEAVEFDAAAAVALTQDEQPEDVEGKEEDVQSVHEDSAMRSGTIEPLLLRELQRSIGRLTACVFGLCC